jgi:hypothetical protein
MSASGIQACRCLVIAATIHYWYADALSSLPLATYQSFLLLAAGTIHWYWFMNRLSLALLERQTIVTLNFSAEPGCVAKADVGATLVALFNNIGM